MTTPPLNTRLSKEQLQAAIEKENLKFQQCYVWIEQHMPPRFFEEIDPEDILLIVHSLMGLGLSGYVSHINLKHKAIALYLDSPDADLKVLKHYDKFSIKYYRAFVSNEPPPIPGIDQAPLRIAIVLFAQYKEKASEEILSQILEPLKARNPSVTDVDFENCVKQLGPRFVRSMTKERLIIALDMFFRAKTRDNCQYEVRYNQEWKEKKESPSLQIVLAWRNVPKFNFLYRLAKMIHRHQLTMKRVNATHIEPYNRQNILILSLGLHGSRGGAAWEEADIQDFLQELVTLKYFEGLPAVETTFVDSGLLSGNQGNFIKTMIYFIHQALAPADINMYALDHVEEGVCRHPEWIALLAKAFERKFHPKKVDLKEYERIRKEYLTLVNLLDTGNEITDKRRKNILLMGLHFIDSMLKTNFYRRNKTAFSFRQDPSYLQHLPYAHQDKFPELPYAIFFMAGMSFIGFHIRFRDLARGGLRTVFPEKIEQMHIERNNVFSECYHLAYTQNKKNKDIPEGGAKGIILLEPYERLHAEADIYKRELEEEAISSEEIDRRMKIFYQEQKLEYLHQTQRSYIESFLALINCDPDGKLRAKDIVDYWNKPEYIYLGPDENMHNEMIEWIAQFSKHYNYRPKGAFISSKPGTGINHKEYGVTSLGVNVYMEEMLRFLNIDPLKEPFTVKMSGGPDGDVAGNQMLNLYRYYPKTAKLLATTDVSGTIFDPKGLDLKEVAKLFSEGKPIRFYPPDKLSEGGFLLDVRTKRAQTAYAQQTLCWRKSHGALKEDWLSGNEMNNLLRHNVHEVKADIFIPGGGRPRTLGDHNYKDFLDKAGSPTARAIIEGANLYLTPLARRSLEKLGSLIIKDSSANKGGVICSSFEVLCSLILSEEEFLKEKPTLVAEILNLISARAKDEADLLLRTHRESHAYLTDISEWISGKINTFKDELLNHFQTLTLSDDPQDPLIRCLINYCPPLLRKKYPDRILKEIPDVHKKAIIACHLASRLVYRRGLNWSPSVVDVLPLIASDPHILGD